MAQDRMKGHPMRLELIREGLLVKLANYNTTQGASNWFNSLGASSGVMISKQD